MTPFENGGRVALPHRTVLELDASDMMNRSRQNGSRVAWCVMDEDDRGRAGLRSMDNISNEVQVSHGQIKAALESMQTVEIDGFWSG